MRKKKALPFVDLPTSVEDYTQSANSLFHFMKRQSFLESALQKKALIPRFCLEDVHYLKLTVGEDTFGEIAILQKCFCDIPLHKITATIELSLTEECKRDNNNLDETKLLQDNNHPGFYGRFGIAFSKKWCELKNLQPIHYVNSAASYAHSFSTLFEKAVTAENLEEGFADDILQRLALMKPLRGKMKRPTQIKENQTELEFNKNFHDEQEWRYVPNLSTIQDINKKTGCTLTPIIANPNLLSFPTMSKNSFINEQSEMICENEYSPIWLDFEYSDIKHIIVPDTQARLDIIDSIIDLPTPNFTRSFALKEKHILISKILVLDEIGKDW